MTDIRQIFGKPKETTETVEMITITKKEYDKLKEDSIKLYDINCAGVDECAECKSIYDGRDYGWRNSKKYGELSVCDMCEDTEEEDEEEDEDDYEDWSMDQKQYKEEFDSNYIIVEPEEGEPPATITISIKSYIGPYDKEGEYSIKWNNGRYNECYDDSLKGIKTNIDKKSYFATEVCDLWETQLE